MSDDHALGLLCDCWSYTSKFQVKGKKSTYFGRNDYVLAFVRDCTSLTNPDTKNMKACRYTYKFQVEKKKVTYSGRNDVVTAFVHDCTSLTNPDTKHFVGLQTFVSFLIVAHVYICGKQNRSRSSFRC